MNRFMRWLFGAEVKRETVTARSNDPWMKLSERDVQLRAALQEVRDRVERTEQEWQQFRREHPQT